MAGAWYICGHLRSTILEQQLDCCDTAGLSSNMKRCLAILINLRYCSLVLQKELRDCFLVACRDITSMSKYEAMQ
jgi:hypothetical protein